jgi:CxxC motif-containing protein
VRNNNIEDGRILAQETADDPHNQDDENRAEESIESQEKVKKEIICVGCPKGCRMKVEARGDRIENIEGFSCEKGKSYAQKEFENPTRILPTTVKVYGGDFPLVSVKTEKAIPRDRLLSAMEVIAEVEVKAPIELGDIVVKDILGTGVNVVATRRICKVNS